MKIGILGALEQEIQLIQKKMQHSQTHQIGQLTFITGSVVNPSQMAHEVILVRCGVGKVAATIAATALIMHFQPDAMVNTGSAGGFDTSLNIGDILIANHVTHHDVDVTEFGFELGQVYNMPARYVCDTKLVNAAKHAAQTLDHVHKQGLICTGDTFIGSDEQATQLTAQFPDIAAVEMEGAAVGQTCFTLNIPFVVIRSLSDIAGKTSTVSFKTYLEKAGKHSAELVLAMLNHLD